MPLLAPWQEHSPALNWFGSKFYTFLPAALSGPLPFSTFLWASCCRTIPAVFGREE